MAKNLIRQGKKETSFKKKDEKANFDIFENRGHTKKREPRKEYTRKNPLMSKSLRNELMRRFCG